MTNRVPRREYRKGSGDEERCSSLSLNVTLFVENYHPHKQHRQFLVGFRGQGTAETHGAKEDDR